MSCKHFQHQEQYQRHQQQRQKMWKYYNGFFIAANSRSIIGLYCSRLPLKSLFILICCAVFLPTASSGSEYSPKLNNCYEAKHGFSENINATTIALNTMKVEHDGGSSSNETLNATQPLQQQIFSALPPPTLDSSTSVSGWKCCCWNDFNQEEVECRCEGEALTRVPQILTVPMQRLTISKASLPRLRSTGLKVYGASLLDIVLTDLKYLECIEDGAFASLKVLRTIYISHAPMLTFLAKDVFQGMSESIKVIRIMNSGLIRVPDLRHLPPENILQMIDLDNNHITRIDKNSIRIKTEQLILANNDISYIDDSAFFGSQIAMLILKENRMLQEIHPNAFNGISMQHLDLSSTSLIRLPSAGLQDIEELRIENTHTLKTIPSIYNFQNLQRAYLTHSFHCCAFKYPSRHDPRRHAERMLEIAEWQQQCTKNAAAAQSTQQTENASDDGAGALPSKAFVQTKQFDQKEQQKLLRQRRDVKQRKKRQIILNSNENSGTFSSPQIRPNADDDDGIALAHDDNSDVQLSDMGDFFDNREDDYMSDSMIKEIGTFHDEIVIDPNESQLDEYCGNFTHRQHNVECYPVPNDLNPCEDVMGYQWLRISVWIVLFLAVVGNVAVLMVILTIRSEAASVQRFLMCHLAFADLCLGLYLLLIAAIDVHSMGEYFNDAYDWQYGAGCKLAGFLTVFATHLSVYTLTVITIERWLAIAHAMYLNRRIKLKPAAYIMAGGWIMSIVMSLLPLFGISNYSSTSICLPMENRDLFDTIYLVSLLGLNGVSFCIIAICYVHIYLSLGYETRHARNSNSGEMGIAKKMALLVFTNFSCWAPIAFFGLTALAGYPLINVTKSKILLVFFYPLNSCADPYLYAILTTQYRQDLYTFLSKFGICKKRAQNYRDSISYQHGTTNISVHGSSVQRKSSHSPKLRQSNASASEAQVMLKERCDFV